jgi:hypothetical protein
MAMSLKKLGDELQDEFPKAAESLLQKSQAREAKRRGEDGTLSCEGIFSLDSGDCHSVDNDRINSDLVQHLLD